MTEEAEAEEVAEEDIQPVAPTKVVPKKAKKQAGDDAPLPPDPIHDAKFTSSDDGQAEFGTYSDEGKAYFKEMTAKIKKNKADDKAKILELEGKMLEKLKLAATKATKNKKRKNSDEVAADNEPPANHAKIVCDVEEDF